MRNFDSISRNVLIYLVSSWNDSEKHLFHSYCINCPQQDRRMERPCARPTNGISMEFEIQSKYGTL